MNDDLNKVKLTPENRIYKDKEILKVISVVVAEDAKDNGYMAVNEDGERVFVPAKHFEGSV